MGYKYDAVKIGSFMRSRVSEDWNIPEVIIFVVVPFVNYNLHASTYTHTHTHTHTHTRARARARACTLCLQMKCCTRRIPFFDGGKALKNMLTLILLTWRIWWAPNNDSKWQTGFNSTFKGIKELAVRMATVQNLEFLRRSFPVNSNKYAGEVRYWGKNVE